MNAKRKFVDTSSFSAQIENADLCVGNTTTETRFRVRLVLTIAITVWKERSNEKKMGKNQQINRGKVEEMGNFSSQNTYQRAGRRPIFARDYSRTKYTKNSKLQKRKTTESCEKK